MVYTQTNASATRVFLCAFIHAFSSHLLRVGYRSPKLHQYQYRYPYRYRYRYPVPVPEFVNILHLCNVRSTMCTFYPYVQFLFFEYSQAEIGSVSGEAEAEAEALTVSLTFGAILHSYLCVCVCRSKKGTGQHTSAAQPLEGCESACDRQIQGKIHSI